MSEKIIRMPKWKALILASRPPFLQVTLASIIIGIVIAWIHNVAIDPLLALFVLLIGILFHLSVNLVHEYWDWKSGTDNINVNAIRPFTGGSGMIQLGLVTPKEELAFGLSLMIIGIILGIYVILQAMSMLIPLLIIGAIAVISIVFYTGSPLKLSHRGLGELFVFLNFGPLMSLGAYIVLAQRISLESVIGGTLTGILTAAILYINEFPDAEADAKAGKRHLVVRLGLRKARYGYAILALLPYIIQLITIPFGLIPWTTLITVVTLPIALKNIKICFKNYNNPKSLFPANLGTIKHHLVYSTLLILGYVTVPFLPFSSYISVF